MAYTHLTTNELVMIEAYVENGISVLKMAQSLKRSRQTIHKVVTFLKQGKSANDYYQFYKANKSRCGRRQ
ncbi:helix-turn-helix domain-containing protein, partial [Streptococcus castoreus]